MMNILAKAISTGGIVMICIMHSIRVENTPRFGERLMCVVFFSAALDEKEWVPHALGRHFLFGCR